MKAWALSLAVICFVALPVPLSAATCESLSGLSQMARIPDRGQARNGRPVASKRICIILDPPLKTLRSRSARNRQRNPRVGP